MEKVQHVYNQWIEEDRVRLGTAFRRWVTLKGEMGFSSDDELANFLLDRYYATKNVPFIPGNGASFPARFDGLPPFYPRAPSSSTAAHSGASQPGLLLPNSGPPYLQSVTPEGGYSARPLVLQNFPHQAESPDLDKKPVIVDQAQDVEESSKAGTKDMPGADVPQQPVFPRDSIPRGMDSEHRREKSPAKQTVPVKRTTPPPEHPTDKEHPVSPVKSSDNSATELPESPEYKDMVDYPDGYTEDRDDSDIWCGSDDDRLSPSSSFNSDEEQMYWSKRKKKRKSESDTEWMPNGDDISERQSLAESSGSEAEVVVKKTPDNRRRRRKPKNPRSTKVIVEVAPVKRKRGRPPKDKSGQTSKTPRVPRKERVVVNENGHEDGDENVEEKEDKDGSAKKSTPLYTHRLVALGDGEKVHCQKCNVTFETWKEGEDHVGRVHAYTCDICYRTFITAWTLKKHREDEHDEPHDYRKVRKNSPKNCPVCSASFLYYKSLLGHMRQSHASEPPPKPLPSNLYECQVCKESGIVGIVQFGLHVTAHFRKEPLVKCKIYYCMLTFPTDQAMEEHCQSKHGELLKKERSCLCQECGMMYPDKRSLKNHIHEVHTRIRNFPCDWPGCDKSFFRNDHLLQHLMIHTGEKPLMCEFCNFTCRQQNSLRCHMKKHGIVKSTEKPKDEEEKQEFTPRRGRKKWDQTKVFPYTI